ncbi:hypothetical protein ABQZ99_019835 [Xanthomonas hortorum pv. vitians]|uniref:Uncharacterized protein n=1 Tax=Xanthomonas hortorum pv. vitians TaxID=83224 RepID=A0A6V7C3H9_9XANT|nr:hypothetical protein [Xanthomonas hortorum]CAD0357536.1 hypothetical protein CFBP2044_42140 [Xanthomonas hortorum pv. cynarae]MCC8493432.1 hypothetical protein [Xanthomonas hortorum pv. gardneri]MCE4297773.1 hypothetical protein [Xanthomonas hortorum pv. vitians]MCE4311604.1 hypothetical protein [Xanthomonas hortorum pv. vitians]MCE4516679.1 hypothetical protein [Xanthomonas hortorum pv. vitians]
MAATHSGQAATSATARALEALLQVPAVARNVPVPANLHANILKLFKESPERDWLGPQEPCTAQQLQAMRGTLADSPVCFYPLGGADAYYPTLLSNAKVTVMTCGNSWGSVADIGRALNVEGSAGGVVTGGQFGGFDSSRDWYVKSEELGFSHGALGPLSVLRAIAAQALNGERVNDIKVCCFDLGSDAGVTYAEAKQDNELNDNIAFWTTTTDGARKLHLCLKLVLPDDEKNIGSLHALLSKISGPGQTLMLEKAIPDRLYTTKAVQNVLAPPATLLKAIVCDGQDRYSADSQPVYAGGTWVQETVKLKRAEGTPEWSSAKFGYGDSVFIHRPDPAAKAHETHTATPPLAMGFRRMFGQRRNQ